MQGHLLGSSELNKYTAGREAVSVLNYGKLILSEMKSVMDMISEKDLETVSRSVVCARRVLVVGVGRVLISLKSWVKRWKHLGIDANYVGSETEGPIGPGDLLIVASASGESIFPVQIAKLAKKFGAKVIYIGSNPKSTCGCTADYAMRVPCRTKLGLPGEFHSQQPMSTLFEQVLFVLGDVLAYSIMSKKHLDEKTVSVNHANLE